MQTFTYRIKEYERYLAYGQKGISKPTHGTKEITPRDKMTGTIKSVIEYAQKLLFLFFITSAGVDFYLHNNIPKALSAYYENSINTETVHKGEVRDAL